MCVQKLNFTTDFFQKTDKIREIFIFLGYLEYMFEN